MTLLNLLRLAALLRVWPSTTHKPSASWSPGVATTSANNPAVGSSWLPDGGSLHSLLLAVEVGLLIGICGASSSENAADGTATVQLGLLVPYLALVGLQAVAGWRCCVGILFV